MGVAAVLDITHSALLAQRAALEVTGHNIANADTEGYSRQRVAFTTRNPLPMGSVILGTGVDLEQIMRSYNRFATMNIDRKTSTLGDLEARSEYLGILETVFSETADGGLEDRLSAFWAGWQDVANNPNGSAERLALIQHAEELVSLIQTRSEEITSISAELRSRITEEVSEINDTLSQVAQLNNEILGMEVGGASANDLRDQRDLLLHGLSEAVDCNYFEGPDGQVTVFIAGRLMVDNCNAYSLETAAGGGSSVAITWHGSQAGTEDISSLIEGGQLGGHLTLLNDTLPGFAGSLDDLAEALAFEVNAVHSQGVGQSAESSLTTLYQATDADEAMASTDSGLHYWERIDNSGTAGFKIHIYDANGDPLVAGGDTITITADMTLNELATALDAVNGIDASVTDGYLTISAAAGEGGSSFAFSEDSSGVLAALGLNAFFSGHDASTLAVVATSESIAAAKVQSDSTFGLGDGSNALDIADLEDTRVDVGGTTQTFGDALGALLGDIAVEAASVERSLTFQDSMVEQLTTRRDSETGVSLDEEMTNMIKFQHAYTAAAKLLKVADEMLETLIGMK